MLTPLRQTVAPLGAPELFDLVTFDPSKVTSASLAFWYDAFSNAFQDTGLTTPVTDGSAFAGWGDKSGNNVNATQATPADVPVYRANDGRGFPALFLNNAAVWLATGHALTAPYTLVVVANQLAALSGTGLLSGAPGSRIDASTGAQVRGSTVSTTAAGTGAVHALILRVPGTGALYSVDGNDKTTTTGIVQNFPAVNIGSGSVSFATNAYVYEVIAYSGALSDYELARLFSYLDLKWGIHTYLTGDVMTGVIDCSQAPYFNNLQAAVNAVPSGGGTVWVPNSITLTAPVLIQTSFTTLSGPPSGKETVTLSCSHTGPAIVVTGTGRGPSLTAALLTGSGQALSLLHTDHSFLQLRDLPSCDLNGLAALCIEFAWNPSNASTGGAILQSSGQRTSADSITTSVALQAGASGAVTAKLNVAGTTHSLSSSTGVLVNGTTTYLALTYDGSTVRLFGGAPGGTCALLASTSASGTVTHPVEEDFVVGNTITTWPEGGFSSNAADGTFDGLRISNTARYTSAFTAPTAKPATDSNTLLLLNFDNFIADGGSASTSGGPILKATVGTSSAAYLVWRRQPLSPSLTKVGLRELSVSSTAVGMVWIACNRPWLDRVGVTSSGNGIIFFNNDYLGVFNRITLQGSSGHASQYGLMSSGSASAYHLISPDILGYGYSVIAYTAAALIENFYVTTETNTIAHLLFKGDGGDGNTLVLNFPNTDDEGGSASAVLQCALWFDSMDAVMVNGGKLEIATATTPGGMPVVRAKACNSPPTFNNVIFHVGTQVTQIFQSEVGAANPMVENGCVREPFTPSWGS